MRRYASKKYYELKRRKRDKMRSSVPIRASLKYRVKFNPCRGSSRYHESEFEAIFVDVFLIKEVVYV
jgi:hypothetical protein